ncbi:MAG: transporter-like protein [Proteobacteria bacterium]|nr:transporter-like protein [Pseudomonadota bacterium]
MIHISNLKKHFGAFAALGPLSFSTENERIVSVVGPSGCGKSTLLRLVAGLESPSAGRITLDGEPITGPDPRVSVAFQEPRLMPWLSVEKNVELAVWDWEADQRRQAVSAVLAKVGLTRFAQALPKQLSGGMAQRVGLARALVGAPKLLLLDEPFGSLDPLTRIRMQEHLIEIVGEEGPAILLITHDIEEALVLSDRVLVFRGPPASLQRDLTVSLPWPRERTSADFQALKALLLEDLLPQRIAASA